MAEKYFRTSDLRKLCDNSRDWGVPTFTAREIAETVLVRCKDCEFKDGDVCDYSAVYVHPNGFCNWGKRREE